MRNVNVKPNAPAYDGANVVIEAYTDAKLARVVETGTEFGTVNHVRRFDDGGGEVHMKTGYVVEHLFE